MPDRQIASATFAPAAEVSDLSVTFTRPGRAPVHAIRGVSLTIARGEIVGVIGESGSGKSVLARTLMGLTPASSAVSVAGSARVCGREMAMSSEKARRVTRRDYLGMIFQDPMSSLDPTMRVGRQVAEAAGSTRRAVELLDVAGVPDPASRLRAYPHELSGGLRQRVMVAIALSQNPALIIADEPTTALDVTVQARLLDTLKALCAETGTSMMFITHDLAVASVVVDRMIVMRKGLIVEEGTKEEVLRRPQHAYTRALLVSRISLASDRTRPLPVVEYDEIAEPVGPDSSAADGSGAAALEDIADRSVHIIRPAEQWVAPSRSDRQVVSVEHVTKTYPIRGRAPLTALDDVSLALAEGESVAVVGESGSGKSTLLRLIAGLEDPTSGVIRRETDIDSQIVFQDSSSSLTPWLSVGTLLSERLEQSGLSRSAQRQRMLEVFGYVDLDSEILRRRPRQLSGGQKQRIALARAIVATPKLLLCDEPTSALDATRAAAVLNQIGDIRRRFGMTLLFITHDIAAARIVSDRIVVMQKGRIVEQGPSDQIVTNPRDEYTRRLLAAVPEMLGEPGVAS